MLPHNMPRPLHRSPEPSLQHPGGRAVPRSLRLGAGDVPSRNVACDSRLQPPAMAGGWRGAATLKPGTFSWSSHAALQLIITCRGVFRSYL